MNPERYERIQRLFEAVRELAPDQRRTHLDAECATDAELRCEVESLLDHADLAASQMPTRSVAKPAPGPMRRLDMTDPQEVGPYRVLSVLGEGGFGIVYLAEQVEPLHRRVALKIIKPGMDSKAVLARFEQERQALALMDHPNVAKVFDAGTSNAGRPYFVMEYVPGVPITDYCDLHRLTTRQRLELFIPVCEAVQHAHMKGIIHRDIKPSNILVGVTGSEASPRVIDFGVAKAIARPLIERTVFTEFGQLIGTPEYMSPEQAEMSGLDIDTRTDVYSLGVVLYELLAGALPFEPAELRHKAFTEIQRTLREVEPPRPSSRLTVLARDEKGQETVKLIADKRQTTHLSLCHELRRELEWIPLKAMRKDRAERYRTAQEMADDVHDYLAGRPLFAGPTTAGYRMRKFLRRNRAPVAAAVAILLLLTAGLTATSAMALWARRAERETRQVADFQASMLSDMDAAALGSVVRSQVVEEARQYRKSVKAPQPEIDAELAELNRLLEGANFTNVAVSMLQKTILERAVQSIYDGFDSQPEVQARLLDSVAHTQHGLGLRDEPLELLTRVHEIRRRVLPAGHPDTLSTRNDIAYILYERGKLEDADLQMNETLQARRAVLGDENPDTLVSLNNLGLIRLARERYSEAEPCLREALDKRRRVLGSDDPQTLTSVNNMGHLLKAWGKSQEAMPYYEEALDGRRRVLGDDDRETLISIINMGSLLRNLKQLQKAEPYYIEAAQKTRLALGDDDPLTVTAINNLGALRYEQERWPEAAALFRTALEKRRVLLGRNHRATLTTLFNLGKTQQEQGGEHLAEAEANLREAIDRFALVKDVPNLNDARTRLGRVLTDVGRFSDAEAALLATLHDVAAGDAGGASARACREALAALYEAWDRAEPGAGYAAKAAEYREAVGGE